MRIFTRRFAELLCILSGLLCLGAKHPLQAQASLPMYRTNWNPGHPSGWIHGNDNAVYENGNWARLDAEEEWIQVELTEVGGPLVYALKGYTGSGSWTGKLEILSSPDGNTWTTVRNLTGGISSSGGGTFFADCLPQNTRWVRWYFAQKGNGNLGLDNARVYAQGGSHGRIQSARNGKWTDPNTWNGGNIPHACNCTEILINNGHTVILDQDVMGDQIHIQAGGTLELGNYELFLHNGGAGADLRISGTLHDRASSVNGIRFVGNSTWYLRGGATYLKSANSNSTDLRDHFEGGIAQIPADAFWILRYTGGSQPTFVSTGGMYYPNLIFESNAGTWNPGGFGSRFTGSSARPIIKGNLDIGGGGSGDVRVYSQNTHVDPIEVRKNIRIKSGSVLTNQGTAIGRGWEVLGNLIVEGQLIIKHTGNTGKLLLAGNTEQRLQGDGSYELECLELNKSVNNLVLRRNLRIGRKLIMQQGDILTGGYILELGESGQVGRTGELAYTQGRVVGQMKRWVAGGQNSGEIQATFPLGYGGKARTISIQYTTSPSQGGSITTQFLPSDMGQSGLPIMAEQAGTDLDITATSKEGYWDVQANDGLTGGTYSISLTGEGFSGIGEISENLTLLKRTTGGPWKAEGDYVTPTGNINNPIVARKNLQGFSQFGFGGGGGNLPVEWLDIHAGVEDQQVKISWGTAIELNNSHFVVERSTSVVSFQEIGQVAGNGTTDTPRYYSFTDSQVTPGQYYYRLKQVDFDGTFRYSHLLIVKFEAQSSLMVLGSYPNPVSSQWNLSIATQQEGDLVLHVFDPEGQPVVSRTRKIGRGTTDWQVDVSMWVRGIYFYRLYLGEYAVSGKFVVF